MRLGGLPIVIQQLVVRATTGKKVSNDKSLHCLLARQGVGVVGSGVLRNCKIDLGLWVGSCCIHFASLFFQNCCFPGLLITGKGTQCYH